MDENKDLPDLYSFLVEAELQQYYTSLKWVKLDVTYEIFSHSFACPQCPIEKKFNETWERKKNMRRKEITTTTQYWKWEQMSIFEWDMNFFLSVSRNELKITAIHQLKYATDQDFRTVGFSRPEIRRLHKFYDKYCSQGYLSKIKRLLQNPVTTNKRDEVC